MKGLSSITKHIKSNAAKYITKGIGLGTVALVVRDAHKIGKMEGDFYASEKDASNAAYYINNTLYNPSMSKTTDDVKGFAMDMELDQTWRRFFNLGIGYVKGFTSMLTSLVVPLGLGLGAVLTKGLPAKICAGGALVYGAVKLVKNFFGIGVPRGPLE